MVYKNHIVNTFKCKIPVVILMSCVILGKLLTLSVPQFLHL